jgi:hypothetical protein
VRTRLIQNSIDIAFRWRSSHIWLASRYTWGPVTTLDDFGGALGQPLDTFSFGLSQFHGHGSWFVCEMALIYSSLFHCPQINKNLAYTDAAWPFSPWEVSLSLSLIIYIKLVSWSQSLCAKWAETRTLANPGYMNLCSSVLSERTYILLIKLAKAGLRKAK